MSGTWPRLSELAHRLALPAAGLAAVGLLVAVAVLGWRALSTDDAGSLPDAVADPSRSAAGPVAPVVVAERVAGGPRPVTLDPSPAPPAPEAARAAEGFVQGVVDLPSEDRERWVRAYATPAGAPGVLEVVSAWVRQLNAGDEPDPADATVVRVRTLGYRPVPAGDEAGGTSAAATVRVVLWHEVTRDRPEGETGPAGTIYVLSHLTLEADAGSFAVASVEGFSDAPAPGSGADTAYLPIGP
ncbi:MAG: hypothetical protein ACFCVF_00535 [Kineosporiaceae bacterium]